MMAPQAARIEETVIEDPRADPLWPAFQDYMKRKEVVPFNAEATQWDTFKAGAAAEKALIQSIICNHMETIKDA